MLNFCYYAEKITQILDFEKKVKKGVDNKKLIWYINCALWKRAQENDLWKLSKTSIWVAKETNYLNKIRNNLFFFESLILAQD